MDVDRLAARLELLEVLAGGIRGPHEQKHASAPLSNSCEEGLDAIVPEVGIERQRVGDGSDRVGSLPEECLGVGRRGAADIAPFGVADHEKAPISRDLRDAAERLPADGPETLEEAGVGLHGDGVLGDGVDDALEIAGRRGRGVGCPTEGAATRVARLPDDLGRQALRNGVETDHETAPLARDRSVEPVGEVFLGHGFSLCSRRSQAPRVLISYTSCGRTDSVVSDSLASRSPSTISRLDREPSA